MFGPCPASLTIVCESFLCRAKYAPNLSSIELECFCSIHSYHIFISYMKPRPGKTPYPTCTTNFTMMDFLTYIQVLTNHCTTTIDRSSCCKRSTSRCHGERDTLALCAYYANCTINEDLKTVNCPCYELSGPSLARIDIIPNPGVKQATINTCTDANACSQNNAPICEAIADGTEADAVSTFS